ncbi:MAG: hypothetical protein AABZ10_14410 [Nitrospirota bacterium]
MKRGLSCTAGLAAFVLVWNAFGTSTVSAQSRLGGQDVTIKGDVAGVYEYVYEHNTKDLIENHCIILEQENDAIVGRYYGTSDDFDDMREGYLPGFFVALMKKLVIHNNKISFRVDVREGDFFLHPIDLKQRSPKDVNPRKNPRWIADYQPGIALSRYSVSYSGSIQNGEIRLNTGDGERIFKKIGTIGGRHKN